MLRDRIAKIISCETNCSLVSENLADKILAEIPEITGEWINKNHNFAIDDRFAGDDYKQALIDLANAINEKIRG